MFIRSKKETVVKKLFLVNLATLLFSIGCVHQNTPPPLHHDGRTPVFHNAEPIHSPAISVRKQIDINCGEYSVRLNLSSTNDGFGIDSINNGSVDLSEIKLVSVNEKISKLGGFGEDTMYRCKIGGDVHKNNIWFWVRNFENGEWNLKLMKLSLERDGITLNED